MRLFITPDAKSLITLDDTGLVQVLNTATGDTRQFVAIPAKLPEPAFEPAMPTLKQRSWLNSNMRQASRLELISVAGPPEGGARHGFNFSIEPSALGIGRAAPVRRTLVR